MMTVEFSTTFTLVFRDVMLQKHFNKLIWLISIILINNENGVGLSNWQKNYIHIFYQNMLKIRIIFELYLKGINSVRKK